MTRPLLSGTLLFHLNLSYSAIEAGERAEVVRRCYRPILLLLDRLPWLVLALEAPGHTLERARELDPEWIERLRERVHEGRVELVGSGDTQLIGPLVPASVNEWNQRLGQETHAALLGHRPRVALVGEMAWSQGIVDAYVGAGYRGLVMEWNNPRRAHPEWRDEWRYGTVSTTSSTGRSVRVLWADAVAFQKLQRAAMGELEERDYVDWVLARGDASAPRHLSLYANDAEVFDYRPGRYRSEPRLESSEWERMERLLTTLHAGGVRFTTPSAVLEDAAFDTGAEVVLGSVADPVPVKKQPKYNATRWALTGRDDLGLNTRCFARARELERTGGDREAWRALCRDWSSDLRTHLTEERWRDHLRALEPDPVLPDTGARAGGPLGTRRVERSDRELRLSTDDVELVLLPRRGLAIGALAFPSVAREPLCGTLPHGTFDDIEYAADFYSGHVVLDVPAEHRVTDLERTEPEVEVLEDRIEVRAEVPTGAGALRKTVTVLADSVRLEYAFSRLGQRPAGTLRAGFVTLLPGGLGDPLFVRCANGGAKERFEVTGDFDHGAPVSPLVSARAVLGATDGTLELEDGRRMLELSWPNWRAAALPLLSARSIGAKRLVRVAFSLAELDETLRPGAPLTDFSMTLSARRLAA